MLHSLSLYYRLVSIKVRGQMQYRMSFLFDIGTTALLSGTGFLVLALILQKFEGIAGWSLYEIALLYGMVETSFGLMDMIFSGFDPQYFGNQIRLGSFDQMLLRPINLTLQVFSSEFIARRLGLIFQGCIVLALALSQLHIQWTVAKLFYLPVILVSQICFFGSLFIIGATITFWTIESVEIINVFTYGGTEMMAYPMNIYPRGLLYFFTFILPAIFMNYYPALYLLDKPDPLSMPVFVHFIAPLVGLGLLLLALTFWRFGIRHYQSTGS